MDWLEKLQEEYEAYAELTVQLQAKASPTDGLLGLTKGPQDAPEHDAFYQKIDELTDRMAAASPSAEEAAAVTEFLLTAAERYRAYEMAQWMMIPAEGLALKLIPFLESGEAARLLRQYEKYVPRFRRFPVQKQVVGALKKQGKG